MAFKSFQDIIAWQRAREVNRLIYAATSENSFSRDFALRDQIRRASISIMANIAEGFGRSVASNKDFANFINIARASAFEVQSHLYVALDLGYLGQEIFGRIFELLNEICRMLHTLRQRLLE